MNAPGAGEQGGDGDGAHAVLLPADRLVAHLDDAVTEVRTRDEHGTYLKRVPIPADS